MIVQGDDETTTGQHKGGTETTATEDAARVRRRRRAVTAITSGLLVAGLVAVTGITVHQIVGEPVPLEPYGWSGSSVHTQSSALCGVVDPDGAGATRHLAVSLRLDNVTDGPARIDRIAFEDVHGVERFDLSAAVVPPSESDQDRGNVVGDDVTTVAGGVHLGPSSHLDVPRGDGVLLVVDMRLDREADHGGAPRLGVSWTGALGLHHEAVLEVGVGVRADDHQGSCSSAAAA